MAGKEGAKKSRKKEKAELTERNNKIRNESLSWPWRFFLAINPII